MPEIVEIVVEYDPNELLDGQTFTQVQSETYPLNGASWKVMGSEIVGENVRVTFECKP